MPLLSLGQIVYKGKRVQMFATEETALQHLTDHWLTGPECELWSLLEPLYWEIVGDPQNYGDRDEYLKSVERGDVSSQPLYERYVAITGRELREARCLGWYVEHEDEGYAYAMGTNAIFMVIARVRGEKPYVKTAYIPAQGDPAMTRKSRSGESDWTKITRESERKDHHLTIEGGGTRVQVESKKTKNKRNPRKQDGFEENKRWRRGCVEFPHKIPGEVPEVALFYLGFRPAVQYIRSRCVDNASASGGESESFRDIHRLSAVLPRTSELSLEEWKEIRSEVAAKIASGTC